MSFPDHLGEVVPPTGRSAPAYPIGSVDNTLRILLLLRDRNRLSIADVAAELGVARSSAHRLMAMLSYYDFVRQAPADRTYGVGPALLECGLLAGSFIPAADVKAVRDVIRYRAKIAQQRVSEISLLGNVLQDAGIKLDSVAWSVSTKSGRLMIEALIDGERRGAVLADLAIGRMRSKIADLSMALEGRFGDHHAMLRRLHLDHLDGMLAKLDAQIEAMMQPFRPARELLITVPGSGRCPVGTRATSRRCTTGTS